MKEKKKLLSEQERGDRKTNYWLICLPSMIMSIAAIIISLVQLLK